MPQEQISQTLIEDLKEDKTLLKTHLEAEKERNAELNEEMAYLSKIIMLYENIINYSKEEAQMLTKEHKSKKSSVKNAVKKFQASIDEVKEKGIDSLNKTDLKNELTKLIESAESANDKILKVFDKKKSAK